MWKAAVTVASYCNYYDYDDDNYNTLQKLHGSRSGTPELEYLRALPHAWTPKFELQCIRATSFFRTAKLASFLCTCCLTPLGPYLLCHGTAVQSSSPSPWWSPLFRTRRPTD